MTADGGAIELREAPGGGLELYALCAAYGFSNPPLAASMRATWTMLLPERGLLTRAFSLDSTAQEAIWILGPLLADDVRAVAPVARARNAPVIAFSTDRTVAGDGVFLHARHLVDARHQAPSTARLQAQVDHQVDRLAVGEFVARTRWNVQFRTRALVGAAAAFVLYVHHVAVPWYAKERSPYGNPELVDRFVGDHGAAVVCFPRNCDSLARSADSVRSCAEMSVT